MTTRLAGVVGWPVAHSRSPRLHRYWLDLYGIDGAYLPLPVAPSDVATAIAGLCACGFAGVNVTLPHKQAVFSLCDSVDDAARQSGSVNTLVFQGGLIHGSDTDGFGFRENLCAHGVMPGAGEPALILGAGGAARAVASSLAREGVAVSVASRNADHAHALAAALSVRFLPWAARSEALGKCALLVNATSAGMVGQAALDMDLTKASPACVVADLVYVPPLTPLLAAAAAHGLRTVGGLGMLLHQARPGFAAWFGREPMVDDALHRFMAGDDN
jgi:shikimate dehydrogenase